MDDSYESESYASSPTLPLPTSMAYSYKPQSYASAPTLPLPTTMTYSYEPQSYASGPTRPLPTTMAYSYEPQSYASAPTRPLPTTMAYPDEPQSYAYAPTRPLPTTMAYPDEPQSYASAPTLPLPTTIIGRQYCVPYQLDLAVVKNDITISDGNFAVITDVDGKIVLKVKCFRFTLHSRRLLFDTDGYPIITLRRKIMTMHGRWKAYKGESTEAKDHIFTLKRSSLIQFTTKLDVFLARNRKRKVCDFKIQCNRLKQSCKVYAGESTNIVAMMHKKHTVQSNLSGKGPYMVRVYPNVDYAFIVALIVILDEINADEENVSLED